MRITYQYPYVYYDFDCGSHLLIITIKGELIKNPIDYLAYRISQKILGNSFYIISKAIENQTIIE